MMLRKFVFCLLICLLVVSCKGDLYGEKVVSKVAEQYCTYLLNGDYGAYVDASYRPSTLHESDRSELIDNLKMFIEQQERAKQGIKKMEVESVEVNKEANTADVFLLLTYGDGSHETVLQPMIMREGLWYLR